MHLIQDRSIKTRLAWNSASLILLFALALGLYHRSLGLMESSFSLILDNEHYFQDKAERIDNLMNHTRRLEQEFLRRKDSGLAEQINREVESMLSLSREIEAFAARSGEKEIQSLEERLQGDLREYHAAFGQVAAAHQTRGLTHDEGLQGRFRDASHVLLNEHTMDHAVGELLISVEELFHAQEELDRTNGDKESRLFHAALDDFATRLKAQPLSANYANRLADSLESYREKAGVATTTPGRKQYEAMRADLESMRALLKSLYIPEIRALVLELRRNEKDYLLRKERIYVDKVHESIEAVLAAVEKADVDQRHLDAIARQLDSYRRDFDALVDEDHKIAKLLEVLEREYADLELVTAKIVESAERSNREVRKKSDALTRGAVRLALGISLFALFCGIAFSHILTKSVTGPLQAILDGVSRISRGEQRVRLGITARDETGVLGRMFDRMAQTLDTNNWLAEGRRKLVEELREDRELDVLCRAVIGSLCKHLGAQVGTFYAAQEDNRLRLAGSYSFTWRKQLQPVIEIGSGLVGEAAREKEIIVITEVPENYVMVESSLGSAVPRNIIAVPAVWQGLVQGVMEIGAFTPFGEEQISFLRQESEAIAIALNSTRQRDKTLKLLQQTQEQAEKLQTQQEELRVANEELESQTQSLQRSEEELRSQQEELRVTNEELEEKTEYLERQKREIEAKNQDLETARNDLQQKAEELAASSRYKSEFMANMSHELRTPLNSLLLLARNLSQNKAGNLNESQVDSANIIYNSGRDLLNLINDILDLSKIEAGRMELAADTVNLADLAGWVRVNFLHLLAEKGLSYSFEQEGELPETIVTDRQRLEQVLRNLVANAIKFTDQGSITVRLAPPADPAFCAAHGLSPGEALTIAVRDTGIGIPPAKQRLIFEAFRQVDGGTARKYGGTGLGLTISRTMAHLLGGDIQLESEEGKGSTFTLYLPFKKAATLTAPPPEATPTAPDSPDLSATALPTVDIPDDRETVGKDDKTMLIIEDDPTFAKILMAQARDKGFKCLVSASGGNGLALAGRYQPSAVILDIRLPDFDGWQVLEQLKKNPALRHIPVHMMSAEEKTIEAFKKGAIGFLTKPISEEDLKGAFALIEDAASRQVRDLLIVEDDEIMRREIEKIIGNGDVKTTPAASGAEALDLLRSRKFDCMILDLGLPDMTGFALLDLLGRDNFEIPPVIVYTGRELTREESTALRKYTDTVIIKGVKSEERLLDETALFLHRVVSRLPEEKRKMIASLYDQDIMFRDKKILVVDDDMRNAFALSRILEERGMRVLIANDGRHALDLLGKERDFELVLMDIMMPVMDGYETIGKIRAMEQFWNLPIIALTAKAMTDDREKCMRAGASDYLAKPVEEGRLLSMMRVWLYR